MASRENLPQSTAGVNNGHKPPGQVGGGSRVPFLPHSPSAVRWTVRCAILGGSTYLLFAGWTGNLTLGSLPGGLSPLIAICGLIAAGAFSTVGGAALLVACLAAFRLRWFCRWVCPLGTCNELSATAGKKIGLRPPPAPHIGQYLAFAAVGGALLGFPILLWLDPLAIFSGLGQSSLTPRDSLIGIGSLLTAVGLSLIFPGIWCGRICPLGGLQEILYIVRRRTWKLVLRLLSRQRDSEPQTALVNFTVGCEVSDLACIGRRGLLALLAAGIWSHLSPRWASAKVPPLRPPGARPNDHQFLALCVRCGNCIRACPTRIIQPQLTTGGLFAWLVPRLDFTTDFCKPNCNRCAEVCPSGAIEHFGLDEKTQMVIGKAVVSLDYCLLSEDRECGVCRSHCPYQAIRLQFNEETYTVQPVVDLARCPGCGACEAVCPTTPVKAIRVERIETVEQISALLR
ncbi:MAG: 4Fe-4S binding protein [Thermogutta sp.]